MTHFLHGSTAVRVVEHAPSPVIVAKGKAGPVRRILLCDSGAEGPLIRLPSAPSGTGRAGPSVLGRFTAQLAGLLKGEEETTIQHWLNRRSPAP